MALPTKSVLTRARACIRTETAALAATARELGPEFVATARAVESAARAGRKLIFSGVGKNAPIAQKIAATFNSTGVSSCFLDATQALEELYRGAEYRVDFLPKTKVELAVEDGVCEQVVEAIANVARTGKVGDGKVFVFDLEQALL